MEKKCPHCTMMVPEESTICPCCGKKFDKVGHKDDSTLLSSTDLLDYNKGNVKEKKCPHCAMAIPKDAKICPHCRKTLGFTVPAKIGIGFIALLIFAGIIGRHERTTPKEVSKPIKSEQAEVYKPIESKAAEEKLTLEDFNVITKQYGNKYIVGTVRNNMDKEYKYAQISFSLYDSSGAQVGTAWTNISNLESGGVWKFEALILKENAVTVKFKGITAY